VAVNTFAPVFWIELGDIIMAIVLTTFLLTNAARMFFLVMEGTRAPLSLYIREAKTFVLHFLTQKRWRECGEDRSRWLKHFILVTGYLTMMTLVIVFIRWFQVDDSSWHFTSIFGYYATAVLLVMTVEMFLSRLKKEAAIHRYSELSDWLFLILLFLTTLTGILMHVVRLAGWPMGTYVMYVIHLAVAVPMLVIEVPFGKWAHLFYRPLAMFLATVKEKARTESRVSTEEIRAAVGDTFLSCLQCGTCTGLCPWDPISAIRPRQVMRQLTLDTATEEAVDRAVWNCVTCNQCGVHCPRGIDIVEVMTSVRSLNIEQGVVPERFRLLLDELEQNGNPWGGAREDRTVWTGDLDIPDFQPDQDIHLFTCCTTAYDPVSAAAGRALPQLLEAAGVSAGTLGTRESCCGDPAHRLGAEETAMEMARRNTQLFSEAGVRRILVSSPHCFDTFTKRYPGLDAEIIHYTVFLDRLLEEGRLTPAGAVPSVVTYHDPCYLGRHNGVFEAPRRILRSIPGLELVEMPHNREDSLCCGGGGGGVWSDRAPGERFGVVRIREALETGAGIITTACPYCIRLLNEAVVELGVTERIAVRDLAELLLQSVIMADKAVPAVVVSADSGQEVLHV